MKLKKLIKKINKENTPPGAGDPGTRFQALKRVGPPIRNQGSSVDSLQAIGYYRTYVKERS